MLRSVASALVGLAVCASHHAIAKTPVAVFDHSANSQLQTIEADPGDAITVTIANTCPDFFDYATIGLRKPVDPPKTDVADKANASLADAKPACDKKLEEKQLEELFRFSLKPGLTCPVSTAPLFITHTKDFSGYVVHIARKRDLPERPVYGLAADDYATLMKKFKADYDSYYEQGKGSKSCDAIKERALTEANSDIGKVSVVKLQDAVATVVVGTVTPLYELAGGITVSNLTDPRYSLSPNLAGGTGLDASIITRDRSAEDTRRLGFAGFVHVHDPDCTLISWQWACRNLAATLGLGITSGSDISVFVGPSFRLKGQWFLTGGYNWGTVQRLPNGEQLGKSPTSENALTNLGSRTTGAFFFSFSYAFLSPGEAFFKKPFNPKPDASEKPPAADAPK